MVVQEPHYGTVTRIPMDQSTAFKHLDSHHRRLLFVSFRFWNVRWCHPPVDCPSLLTLPICGLIYPSVNPPMHSSIHPFTHSFTLLPLETFVLFIAQRGSQAFSSASAGPPTSPDCRWSFRSARCHFPFAQGPYPSARYGRERRDGQRSGGTAPLLGQ